MRALQLPEIGRMAVADLPAAGPGKVSLQIIATLGPLMSRPSEWRPMTDLNNTTPGASWVGAEPKIFSSFARWIVVLQANFIPLRALIHLLLQRTCGAAPGAVCVSEPDASRCELRTSLGAIALDNAEAAMAPPQLIRRGSRVGGAIDGLGVTGTLADTLGSTSNGGRRRLVGTWGREVSLAASRSGKESWFIVGSLCNSIERFTNVAQWVAAGDSMTARLISAEVAFEDGPEVFEQLAAHTDVPGKLLVGFVR